MAPKKHGTSETPVQKSLKWGVSRRMADRICNYNRHWAEPSGYFYRNRNFDVQAKKDLSQSGRLVFYDSNTGKHLFVLRTKKSEQEDGGRSYEEFVRESRKHGWPSFRDNEVVWQNVRCLRGGECVSLDGTHLGHNLPDGKGNRYCINLVSIAGQPTSDTEQQQQQQNRDEKRLFAFLRISK
ncbi:hypothetical protein ACA910_008508 [Epithemia clementina (nom. ined.)]